MDVKNALVILGAVGDLATRHLLPALFCLQKHGMLPGDLRIAGIDREPLTSQAYRARLSTALNRALSDAEPDARAVLMKRFDYFQADLESECDLTQVLTGGSVIAYMALPPSAYPAAAKALKNGGIAPESWIVVEKPFGEDLASARTLNRALSEIADERHVYRADHFLHHRFAQDLLALRFATPFLEPLWGSRHIERVEIVWEEGAGISGRGAYYDRVGALRDMVQSHLLQLLALIAMERPARFNAEFLQREKSDVLGKVALPCAAEIHRRTARGRYTAGNIGGKFHRGYLEEDGIIQSRGTETYAYLELAIDAQRWRGVPFVLRTGKAIANPRRGISIRFRKESDGFLRSSLSELTFTMTPSRIELKSCGAAPEGLPGLAPLLLGATRSPRHFPPSAAILRDVMAGEPVFAVGKQEVEHSWRIVDTVREVWRTGAPPLQGYAAGSAGPLLPDGETRAP